MGGINLGLAYEFRARVAICAQDRAAFQHYVQLCAEHYHAGGVSPDLAARFATVLNEARRAGVVDATWQARELGPMTLSHAQVELRDRLADCSSADSRCQYALNAISQSAKAAGGYLFGVTERGLALLASSGGDLPRPELAEAAACSLRAEAEQTTTQHTESVGDMTRSASESTASETGGNGSMWRGPTYHGLLAQPLTQPRGGAPLGVFLLRPGGGRAPRIPEPELLEVVADALLAGGDVRAGS